MKTRIIAFVLGIAAAVLGCATTEVRDQFLLARGATYISPASDPDSGWYYSGAITVKPGQVFEN